MYIWLFWMFPGLLLFTWGWGFQSGYVL
jgi:hypothetical protein